MSAHALVMDLKELELKRKKDFEYFDEKKKEEGKERTKKCEYPFFVCKVVHKLVSSWIEETSINQSNPKFGLGQKIDLHKNWYFY